MNNTTLFEVKGQRYVSGLFWQVIFNKSKYENEASNSAKDLDMDLVAFIKDGDIVQAGFASSKENQVINAYSFAATLRDAIKQDSWAGIFKISDTEWTFVAVKDSMVLPGSDTCSNNLDEIVERLSDSASSGDFGYIYAPDGLVDGSINLKVIDILPDKPAKTAKIRPAKTSSTGTAIVAIVLIASIAGGAYAYKSHKDEQAKIAAAAAVAALIAQQQAQQMIPTWTEAVLPSAMLINCTTPIFATEIIKAGWALGDIGCDKTNLNITYSRKGGTVTDLLAVFNTATIVPGGEMALLTVPTAVSPKRPEKEILPLADVNISLTAFLQSIGAQFTLVGSDVAATDPAAVVSAAPSLAMNFKIDSLPVDLGQNLDVFPGLVINEIKWSSGELTWEINGVVYGK